MFNSVAKYFWGTAENEESEDAQTSVEATPSPVPMGESQDVPVVENAMDEDDWVLVGNTGKENSHPSAENHHHHNQFPSHQRSQHPPHPPHHNLSSHQSNCHEPLGHQFAEAELLDEAASLVHPSVGDPCGQLSLPDCDTKLPSDPEDSGAGSGVRPSSPESVFSTCSGRSSATYRPRGVDSEAWIVAPPPCFTGSQCDSLVPVVSDPLENLLIEHPSMSVYVSQPASLLLSDIVNPRFHVLNSALHVSGSSVMAMPEAAQTDCDAVTASHLPVEASVRDIIVRVRGIRGETVAHQPEMTLEKIKKVENASQRKALSVTHRSINRQKCHRQNQVVFTSKGCGNHKNKQLKPSGFRFSRITQRNVSKHV